MSNNIGFGSTSVGSGKDVRETAQLSTTAKEPASHVSAANQLKPHTPKHPKFGKLGNRGHSE